ncbi:MAG: hypothetical protein J6Z01_15055 [Bacteroidales bacterium]|nr:hypothetical protein [Bacteroidales bacterium]
MAQFKASICINASNEENARKIILILKNIADNVPESTYDTLLGRINKDRQFFKKLAEAKNPLQLIKML